jgi:hypothetical protein
MKQDGFPERSEAAASSGGLHPAVDLPPLDVEVLNKVHDLKHYPQRKKVTQSVAEKQENNFAIRICKRWDEFQPSTRSKLELMKQASFPPRSEAAASSGGLHPAVDLPPLDIGVLNEVHDLKHYPQRKMVTQSVAEKQENNFAIRICKRWDEFQPSTRSKLELMKQAGFPPRSIWCEECEGWLNGVTRWRDHLIGKKHKKNCKPSQVGETTSSARST